MTDSCLQVVLLLGLDIKMTNKEGQDRDHGWTGYALPGMQQELARQVAAAGKPVVVVELSGMATGMDFIAAQAGWPVLVGGYGGRFGTNAFDVALDNLSRIPRRCTTLHTPCGVFYRVPRRAGC